MIARRDNDASGERLLAMSCSCASSGRCATCTAWAALAGRLRERSARAVAPELPPLKAPHRATRLRLVWSASGAGAHPVGRV